MTQNLETMYTRWLKQLSLHFIKLNLALWRIVQIRADTLYGYWNNHWTAWERERERERERADSIIELCCKSCQLTDALSHWLIDQSTSFVYFRHRQFLLSQKERQKEQTDWQDIYITHERIYFSSLSVSEFSTSCIAVAFNQTFQYWHFSNILLIF